MPYSLGQAAKATGKSKPTLAAAIKRGRISATKDESGQYKIDPAELHRVYPPVSETSREERQEDLQNLPPVVAQKEAEIRGLKSRLEVMEELVAELRGDKEKAERREVDLKRDVDQWRGFAIEAQQRLKALEAPRPEPVRPQRAEPEPVEADFIEAKASKVEDISPPKKCWFRRVFGG